jgi:hypothetical protein
VAAVGSTYRKTYERYLNSQLRNAAAHVLATEDTFEPLDPEHAGHYRAVGSIFRFIGQHLIRLISLNAAALMKAGVSAQDLETTFYPKTTAKR